MQLEAAGLGDAGTTQCLIASVMWALNGWVCPSHSVAFDAHINTSKFDRVRAGMNELESETPRLASQRMAHEVLKRKSRVLNDSDNSHLEPRDSDNRIEDLKFMQLGKPRCK